MNISAHQSSQKHKESFTVNNTQPLAGIEDDLEVEDDYLLYKAWGDDQANFTQTFRSNTANTMRRTMH